MSLRIIENDIQTTGRPYTKPATDLQTTIYLQQKNLRTHPLSVSKSVGLHILLLSISNR